MIAQQVVGVALGGAAGSLVRFGLTRWLSSYNPHTAFSVGVLAANIGGCFLIGAIFMRLQSLEPGSRDLLTAFLVTGFLGGLTTYSTYALELCRMAHAGAWRWAALYLGVQLLAGLAAVVAGASLVMRIWPKAV